MKLTYDREADALYISLVDGDSQCRVVRLNDDVALDLTDDEQLVGIEVLRASTIFDTPEEPTVALQDLLPKVA